MKKYDIRNIISAIRETVDNHALENPGEWRRWNWQDKNGSRNLEKNEYGCADAVNILYTIGELASDEATRLARIKSLQDMQDPESGMFVESTHNTVHTTAHVSAAIELFDSKVRYPIKKLADIAFGEGIESYLESIDWNSPWPESHKGAGIYAALVASGEMTAELEDRYFAWLWENTDPVSGFWRSGYADNAPYNSDEKQFGGGSPTSIYTYMAGGFHFMFNHEYARRPLRFPDKIIDSCIAMKRCGAIRHDFGKTVGFLEIDWVYCMNRASRQTPHRFDEVKNEILQFADVYIGYLNDLVESGEYKTNERFNDLHMLFGCVCALAELQEALPGRIKTEKPLRAVLNRRPFI